MGVPETDETAEDRYAWDFREVFFILGMSVLLKYLTAKNVIAKTAKTIACRGMIDIPEVKGRVKVISK